MDSGRDASCSGPSPVGRYSETGKPPVVVKHRDITHWDEMSVPPIETGGEAVKDSLFMAGEKDLNLKTKTNVHISSFINEELS